MAKVKTANKKPSKADTSDERPPDGPAELPEPEPEPEAPPIEAQSQHLAEEERFEMVAANTLGYGQHGDSAIVSNVKPGPKLFFLMVGSQRYSHVGDTTDGRWIYRPD